MGDPAVIVGDGLAKWRRVTGLIDFRAKVGGGHDSPLPFERLYRRLRYQDSVDRD